MKQCKELEIKEAEISELKAENADLRSISKDVAAERKKTEAAEAKAAAEAEARAEAEAKAAAEAETRARIVAFCREKGFELPASLVSSV